MEKHERIRQMAQPMKEIVIIGARKHNLKNLDIKIPKNKMITITGVSGSGKSTLAYDTIFQEGQRKYLESLSIYARQFIKSLEKPEVQYIKGISPTISIDQKHSSFFFNSTVGTVSEVSQYLRLLYAKMGQAFCPECGRKIERFSTKKIMDLIFTQYRGKMVQILAPVVKNRKGIYRILFEKYAKRGFLRALVDGKIVDLDPIPSLERNNTHDIAILVDWLGIEENNRFQLDESISLAMSEGNGELIIVSGNRESLFSDRLFCSACDIALREPQPATFSFTSPLGYCPACKGMAVDSRGNPCNGCRGSGFNREALAFRFRDKNIFECGEMEIKDLLAFFKNIDFNPEEKKIIGQIFPHIVQRLESFVKLNLDYMTLNRKVNSISGGELQRTRLVSQIGFGLSGIIYILDEPSIGMHMAEQNNLIGILKELIKKDNTVIVVEHDENTIRSSDFIVDLGPGAGEKGGNLVFSGWYKDFRKVLTSLTADYLYDRKRIAIEKKYRPEITHALGFQGISINNIKGADIKIPLQALTVVTGVSGSGKSSLVIDALYPIMKNFIDKKPQDGFRKTYRYAGMEGGDYIQRVIMVDQSSIGKNSRSCPATYVDLMPVIRDFFAGLTEAKARGYTSSRFSFNVSGGRCEACKGLGLKKIEMSFLPQLEVECPVCDGKRYNSETLLVRYKGLSIADILNLTANEAFEFFRNIPFLAKKIHLLNEVGLGYLKLGQSSVTLSGGESQRIKLCKELSRISSKPTLYVLDEPTIGLHFDDIQKLIDVFHSLILKGSTIVVIEHNLEIIKIADYIIDLGPGGGKRGGKIIYQGKLEGILHCAGSITSEFINQKLKHAV
jgi:excinuclease ABC subunit A